MDRSGVEDRLRGDLQTARQEYETALEFDRSMKFDRLLQPGADVRLVRHETHARLIVARERYRRALFAFTDFVLGRTLVEPPGSRAIPDPAGWTTPEPPEPGSDKPI